MHPLDSIAAQAWNAIKSPTQPEYSGLGVEFQGTLCEKAMHARSGQPIEEGDHPYARFERKVVELGAEPVFGRGLQDVLEIQKDFNSVAGFPGIDPDERFHKEIPVTIEGDDVHVPSFEVPSVDDSDPEGARQLREKGRVEATAGTPNDRRSGPADRRVEVAADMAANRRKGTADRRAVLSNLDPEVHVVDGTPSIEELKGKLPADFPCIDKLHDAGINTYPQLRKRLDSNEHVPGIGPAAEAKIVGRLVEDAAK